MHHAAVHTVSQSNWPWTQKLQDTALQEKKTGHLL